MSIKRPSKQSIVQCPPEVQDYIERVGKLLYKHMTMRREAESKARCAEFERDTIARTMQQWKDGHDENIRKGYIIARERNVDLLELEIGRVTTRMRIAEEALREVKERLLFWVDPVNAPPDDHRFTNKTVTGEML